MVKNMVIHEWLIGKSRNNIAQECDLAQGTVSAIIAEWSQLTGKEFAIKLRDLSLALDNSGLSLVDCITGFRVATISKKCGMNMDEPERFLTDTYTNCLSKGLEAHHVAELLEDLVSNGFTTVSALSEKLKNMKDENERLISSTKKLRDEIADLRAESEVALELRDNAMESGMVTRGNLESYVKAREELSKYGIPIDDNSKFTKVVKWIAEAGYDPTDIINTYSEYHAFKYATDNVRRNLGILDSKISMLEQKEESLERSIASKSQTISQVEELARLGMGLRELRTIRSFINEIADANGIDHNLAWKKFVMDLEQYDTKLGFDKKIQYQRIKLRNLIFLVDSLSERVEALVADSFQNKIREEQKLLFANIMNNHPNIAEEVATQMLHTKRNKKKEPSQKKKGESYSYSPEAHSKMSFDMDVNGNHYSGRIIGERDVSKVEAPREFDPLYEVKEYKRLCEEANTSVSDGL